MYVYTITVPGFLPPSTVGSTTAENLTFEVNGSFVEDRGNCHIITDSSGGIVCLVPLGSVITRNDAYVTPQAA